LIPLVVVLAKDVMKIRKQYKDWENTWAIMCPCRLRKMVTDTFDTTVKGNYVMLTKKELEVKTMVEKEYNSKRLLLSAIRLDRK